MSVFILAYHHHPSVSRPCTMKGKIKRYKLCTVHDFRLGAEHCACTADCTADCTVKVVHKHAECLFGNGIVGGA